MKPGRGHCDRYGGYSNSCPRTGRGQRARCAADERQECGTETTRSRRRPRPPRCRRTRRAFPMSSSRLACRPGRARDRSTSTLDTSWIVVGLPAARPVVASAGPLLRAWLTSQRRSRSRSVAEVRAGRDRRHGCAPPATRADGRWTRAAGRRSTRRARRAPARPVANSATATHSLPSGRRS